MTLIILAATPSTAPGQEAVDFCGFTVRIPDGWIWKLDDRRAEPMLEMKPRCWCDLVEVHHDQYDPVGSWFISNPEYPAILTCRRETVEKFFGSEEEKAWRAAPSGAGVMDSAAFQIEGRGWSGLATSAEMRKYYWHGGNAGSHNVFSAIIYGLQGRVMTIYLLPEETGQEWLFFTALISRP